MQKIGRNELCPCGSGKKYKHCCLPNIKKVSRVEQDDPYFKVVTKKGKSVVTGLQVVQKSIEYLPIENQPEINNLIHHYFSNPSLKVSSGLNELRLLRLRKWCEQHLLYKPKEFFPHIMEAEEYKKLLSKSMGMACSIYWNEIDQHIFYFRMKIIESIRETILRLLNIDDDYVVAFFMVRQLMELTCHAIACQWVLSTSYNVIKRTLSITPNSDRPGYVLCKELEEFAIGLCFWEKKQIRKLGDILGKKFGSRNEYFSQEYQPSTERLIKTTIWVAENFDQAGWSEDRDLKIKVESLRGYYKFLCKFIHPTPMLFNIDEINMYIDPTYPAKQDIINSSKIVFIEVLDRCSVLLNNLFLNKYYLEISFAELIMPLIAENHVFMTLPLEFITDFISRYRGNIELPLDNGTTKEI